MNREVIINLAIRTSKERGYDMFIIFDSGSNEYSFTQEEHIFLYDTQEIVLRVDGDFVMEY